MMSLHDILELTWMNDKIECLLEDSLEVWNPHNAIMIAKQVMSTRCKCKIRLELLSPKNGRPLFYKWHPLRRRNHGWRRTCQRWRRSWRPWPPPPEPWPPAQCCPSSSSSLPSSPPSFPLCLSYSELGTFSHPPEFIYWNILVILTETWLLPRRTFRVLRRPKG